MNDNGIPVRCFCSRAPLLAMCGVDDRTGEPWVHIKSIRNGQIHVEAVVVSGVVKIRCRACERWNRIKIVRGAPKLQEQSEPPLGHLQ